MGYLITGLLLFENLLNILEFFMRVVTNTTIIENPQYVKKK